MYIERFREKAFFSNTKFSAKGESAQDLEWLGNPSFCNGLQGKKNNNCYIIKNSD